jgi:hypothetical protein
MDDPQYFLITELTLLCYHYDIPFTVRDFQT